MASVWWMVSLIIFLHLRREQKLVHHLALTKVQALQSSSLKLLVSGRRQVDLSGVHANLGIWKIRFQDVELGYQLRFSFLE